MPGASSCSKPVSVPIRILATVLSLLLIANIFALDRIIPVLELPDLAGWDVWSFRAETSYSLVQFDGRHAIRAYSNNAASGLIKQIHVNLTETPYLNWSWRVDKPIEGYDETSRDGDDYAARIYIVINGGLLPWRTRAISYVWSGSMPVGRSWPNAYSNNSVMYAVESGTVKSGQWQFEKRNILADLSELHGIQATHIDAVALMTDTDNTGESVIAYYGNIYFSSH